MKTALLLLCSLAFVTGCTTPNKPARPDGQTGIMDIYRHRGEGYSPYLITPDWQVAQLNHVGTEDADHISRLDVHNRTDEAFYLMAGSALLIAADIEGDQITYDMRIMEPSAVFNIRQGVWHNIILSSDGEVLIVENENTHLNDCEYYPFSEQQKQDFMDAVDQAGWPLTP